MITQKEIAARAGVSRATVSRAFTDSKRVSPKNLQKINDTLRAMGLSELDWQQTTTAPQEKYVLVMAGNISGNFFGSIIRGICDQLQKSGIHAVVYNSNHKKELEEEQILLAERNHYLGVILVTAAEGESLSEVIRKVHIPVITVNRYIRSADTDVVCIDNYMGGYVAATYLMENGHTQIGHIASQPNSVPQEELIRGFRDALNVLRPDSQYKVYYGESSEAHGYKLADRLIQEGMPHTALFVADCNIAFGIVNSLHDKGYRVPEDISILCSYVSEVGQNLSAVQYDPVKMGHIAVNTLLQRIGNPSDNKYHVLLVPRLIERNSVLSVSR